MWSSTGARGGLGVHQQPVGGQAEHPHVGAELALVVEQGRVAALAGRERLDVVGHLALQELGGLGSAQLDHRAAGALDEAGVVGEQLVVGGGDHAFDSTAATDEPVWVLATTNF